MQVHALTRHVTLYLNIFKSENCYTFNELNDIQETVMHEKKKKKKITSQQILITYNLFIKQQREPKVSHVHVNSHNGFLNKNVANEWFS